MLYFKGPMSIEALCEALRIPTPEEKGLVKMHIEVGNRNKVMNFNKAHNIVWVSKDQFTSSN